MQRPRTILWFEILFLVSLLSRPINLGLVGKYLLGTEVLSSLLPDRPISPVAIVTGILVSLCHCFLVSRARSRIGAWLAALWILLAIGLYLRTLMIFGPARTPLFWTSTVSILALVGALLALVLRPSRLWLSRRRRPEDIARDFA